MQTLCECGFDCTQFVTQHAIPGTAQFACPVCELDVYAAADSAAATADTRFRSIAVDSPALGSHASIGCPAAH